MAEADARVSFELDPHAEVFESCAYHVWGQKESDARALGTLVLGAAPELNLQPEPALSQILGLEDIEASCTTSRSPRRP